MTGNEALNNSFLLQVNGRAHKLAYPDVIEVVAAYESYLEEQAWAALARAKARKYLDREEYERQAEGVRRDLVAGVWTYQSRCWLESIQSRPHLKKLVHLMGLFFDPEFSMEVVEDVFRNNDKLVELVQKAFRGIVDPNVRRAVPPAAGSG